MSSLEREMEIADLIADRMRRDPKIATIVSDAQMFDQLQQDPGWRRLFEKVKADKERIERSLAKRMFSRKERPSDEEIAFYQGFYQGAVFVLGHPDKAMENLERIARIAWTLVQAEVNDDEGGDSA